MTRKASELARPFAQNIHGRPFGIEGGSKDPEISLDALRLLVGATTLPEIKGTRSFTVISMSGRPLCGRHVKEDTLPPVVLVNTYWL